jgi:peptidoglycan/xylan/chitin deacetylase (PgdA/CDA1 family)
MAGKLPHYYTALPPFRELFGQGNPILTYHKLGPRPGGVRLKGLYLDAALFRRQLAELRAARFSNGTLGECAGPRVGNRVVITFDDGYVNVLRHALEPLAATGFTAVQYLVADLLGRCNEWDVALGEAAEPMLDAGQVRQWLAAGHDIGSHTRTHPYLTRIPLAQAREEIVASKRKLEDLFHRPIEHFCYPYGDWNDAVRDLVAEAGYRTACTTQPGVNDADSSPLALKRVTARYASRRLGNLFGWWRRD